MKIKLSIKNRFTGSVLFEYEKEDNTLKETVEQAMAFETAKAWFKIIEQQ